ncbi:MAG TPA: DUF692 domain-containing protein [Methylomirabilota bacterium]|nr:DUF692 domain-containing protein [Methylomirabilota bacterium]
MISPGDLLGPGAVGIGLRAPHVAEVLASRPPVGWLEVHTENYLGGGPAIRALEALRGRYPIALHGVGLSLGSAEGVDGRHLERVTRLVERIQPAIVSEHLAWSVAGGAYLNHLLPLPYTEESLARLCDNVERTQDRLARRILVENPSSYLRFRDSPIPEPEFLGELVRRTGCGLLCDVNNVFVTSRNLGQDPAAYLAALRQEAIGEIHLAGHARNDVDGQSVLIDDHGSPVAEEVWDLFARAVGRFGARPTLIEWDTDIPALDVLLGEARRAGQAMSRAVAIDGTRDIAA